MGSLAESRLLDALRRTDEITRGRTRTGRGHDDADDDEGTIASDDAIGFNPLPLLRAFDKQGVRVVIMGQVAGILHGSTELTGDLDLLWSGSSGESESMSVVFSALNATLCDDDDRELSLSAESFGLPKVQFRTATASGDCCTPALPWGKLNIERFLDRSESAAVAGIRLHYVSRPDLIAMRLAVGRPKDVRRAAELQQLP
jgi:hypothetical protein